MRSRTGCLTCRQRKLKCDEQKPICGQCQKASRTCQPSSGIVFRHQQNASMNGTEDDATSDSRLKGFYAYKNTFGEESVWLDIPKQVTFIECNDPYADDPSELEPPAGSFQQTINDQAHPSMWSMSDEVQTPSLSASAHGLETLSAVASRDRYSFVSPSDATMLASQLQPGHTPNPTHVSPPAPSPSTSSSNQNHHINFILNHSAMTPPIDPNLNSPFRRPPSTVSRGSLGSRPGVQLLRNEPAGLETDHERSFLLRHFSEGPGQWMDLFDLGCYFSACVPVRALTNPLLKNSALAYAAKQLYRVNGTKAIVGGVCSSQARMELFPDAEHVDWLTKAAFYYDKAISLLMAALQDDRERPQSPWTGQDGGRELDENQRKRRRLSENRISMDSDETLSATVILCVYEFLDNTDPAWSRHLNGTKSLLDVAEHAVMPLQFHSAQSSFYPFKFPSRARKAAFWNFARQDFLAAFINESQTRLDTEDLAMWKAAGLLLDEQGFVQSSNTTESGYPEGVDVMHEDMIANALIWLMSKLINYMAAGDGIYGNLHGHSINSPALEKEEGFYGVNQETLLARWTEIEKEIETWYKRLPDTFKPCARIAVSPVSHSLSESASPAVDPQFQEVWYSIPMCASAMQSYHMIRILLLINKPQLSTMRQSTVTSRLSSYRHIEAEIRFHAHEIVGISLGRMDASARVHSLQPLFVAGQTLSDRNERIIVVQLMRGIERDSGWATEYRVKQLLESWGWDDGSHTDNSLGLGDAT